MPEPKVVTIVDVASAARVSVSTVSRILNGKPDVAADTRAHVLDVIRELGFQPHAQARRLAGGKGRTLAVLYPLDRPDEDPINQLQLDFALGAAAAAGEANYFCNLLTTALTRESLLNLYRGAHIDGLVLMEVHHGDWRVDLLRDEGLPFTMIGRSGDERGADFVDLDVRAAVERMFDHLVELGHRHVGFLTYARHLRDRGLGPALEAWSGYERSLERHDLAPNAREVAFTVAEMTEAAHRLIDDDGRLSAIVSLTDASTGAVVQALSERGLAVPADVSVIGLATDRMAEVLVPPLTAIRFPAYDMGYRAATALIRRLGRSDGPVEHSLLPPELVVRSTTAPARRTVAATAR